MVINKKNKDEVMEHYNTIIALIKKFPENYKTVNNINNTVKISDLVESVTYELNKKHLEVIFEKIK